MNRRIVAVAAALTIASAGFVATSTGAGAIGAACKGDAVKPRMHSEVQRRVSTLAALVAILGSHADPYGANARQVSTLQSATSGLGSLDHQIQSTCYADVAAFRADAVKVFTGYRVYWLRVPQTHVLGAADRLAAAEGRLALVANRLGGLVGGNARARADLAAMNGALQTATAKLGTPPNLAPHLAAVLALEPAADMTAADAALRTAHDDLVAARTALEAARAAGQRTVADLDA